MDEQREEFRGGERRGPTLVRRGEIAAVAIGLVLLLAAQVASLICEHLAFAPAVH